jgi:O-antigen/teichoic acid export membrane protein
LKLVRCQQLNRSYKKLDFYVNAAALLLGKASFVGLRLAALYMLASRIPRETFGAIAFGLTIAEMSRVLGDWGGDTLGLHRYSNTKAGAALSAFQIGLKVRFLSSIVAFTASIIAISCLTNIESKATLLILSLMPLTSLWLNTAVNWLQARGELRSNVWPLLLIGFISLLAQYFLSQANTGINMQLAALLGCEVAIVLFLIVVVHQSVRS